MRSNLQKPGWTTEIQSLQDEQSRLQVVYEAEAGGGEQVEWDHWGSSITTGYYSHEKYWNFRIYEANFINFYKE